MPLRLYDTLTRSLADFRPLKEGKAGLYVCGPTVYDQAHVGHARAAVAFDLLVRHLRASGLEVDYVRNFTDIDDKIIARAKERGIGWKELADLQIRDFEESMGALGCMPPTHAPRATDYIEGMLEDVSAMVAGGHAYAVDGDVFFDVGSLPSYGRLSRRDPKDSEPGARVGVDERKKNPADFALWKAAKPGEPSWPSPWGPGRPGWHTECSTMSARLLGPAFDIHGGGQDLVFPHHENELAQGEALGRPMASIWMHNGFVNVNNEKMSKSLGNSLNVRDIIASSPAEALRFFLLSSHYRGPLDYSGEALEEAGRALSRLYRAMAEALSFLGGDALASSLGDAPYRYPADGGPGPFVAGFRDAMDDDLNTSKALGQLFDAARLLNRKVSEGSKGEALGLAGALCSMGGVLGLSLCDPKAFFDGVSRTKKPGLDEAAIEGLIRGREEARKRKDWKEADRIRALLADSGVLLEDRGGRTTWRLA
ncbi:MAG: cysteine--tRNA ligase [Deltaproteobacteria bacterium]|jgi:cysteinyl-tRNA synthetase|nr:cysteine--tRNA ligase [Deltaproteobacteria bacterium]